jgi:FkbM family methyltransferase
MYAHKIIYKKIHKKINPRRYSQSQEVARWYNNGGDLKFRYSYPINKNSLVIDVGGYEGEWAQKIYNRYHCRVIIFEPVKKYSEQIQKRFAKNKKVEVFGLGLSGRTRKEKISIDEFSSSIFKKSPKTEIIELIDIKEFCDTYKINKIDLIKINIEGGEYELLERIISSGAINIVQTFQVQFHDFVSSAEKRMERIQRELSKTHKPTYQYWFVWECWTKKNPRR